MWMGMMDILDMIDVSTDKPFEDDKSMKGILHHILDWAICQGIEIEKKDVLLINKYNELLSRFKKQKEIIDSIDSNILKKTIKSLKSKNMKCKK
jgi:hypothetical protein